MDTLEERGEFRFVEHAVSPNAGADVQCIGSDAFDRLLNILWLQPAGKEQWNTRSFADFLADVPIVHTPRPAKDFDGKRRIAGIEQDRVHRGRNG